ncbi:MAG: tetratricopeptide repeat protein, partial [Bacteroidota bacterium]
MASANGYGQDSWFEKGKAAKDNNRKVEYFTRAIELERQDNWVYYFRAWAYCSLGRFEKGLKDFKTAGTKEGNLASSYITSGKAWCYYRTEDYENGLKYADQAIEERNNNAEAWNIRGWVLVMLDRSADAVPAFTKYISLKPESYYGYANRSYCYTLTRNFDKCLTDTDKALSLAPNNEFLLERKAYALMKLKRNDEAIDLIKEKIDYKPDDPLSLSNIGNLFYRNEDFNTAIDYHTRGMKLYDKKCKDDREYIHIYRDDIYDIYMSRGDAYYALKDYQRALGDYKKATSLKPGDYRAWHEIGQLQTYQKNWSEGASAYEKAFAIKGDLKYGWVNLGFCYDNLGQPHRAINAYTRGIKNNPDVGLLYNNRGYGYLELKMYDKALSDLQKAIDVEPEIVMSHVSLGEYYYDRQMYAEAIRKFDHALKM